MKENLLRNVLCIKGDILFKEGKWNGLNNTDLDKYIDLIKNHSEFRERNTLEDDPSYKQIIAQVVLKYKDKYFLHKLVKRNEERLNGLCPLPLGGHIDEVKGYKGKDIIGDALMQELSEEVTLNANIIQKDFLGLIYLEDENPVNHLHIGFVHVFELDGNDVHVREEGLENIGFVSLDYLKNNAETLTYWSRVIIYHL